MNRAELQKQLSHLLKTASFLRSESLNLGEQVRREDVKVSRKLNLVVDYLEVAARMSDEIERNLQQVATAIEQQPGSGEEFRFQGDYGAFDTRLNEFLEPSGADAKKDPRED